MRSNAHPPVVTRRFPSLSRLVLAVSLTGWLTSCATFRPSEPAATRYPATLLGSWVVLADAGGASTTAAADTALWELQPRGLLRHADVRGGRVRERSTARWWTESATVDGTSARVLCTSARPGRGAQCARITLDTVTTPDGARRRLTWNGITFRQHWVFVDRDVMP